MRLLVAVACLFALNLALLAGVPVNPDSDISGVTTRASSISARLEPAPSDAEAGADQPIPPRAAQPAPRAEPRHAATPASTPSVGIEMPLIRDLTYYPIKQLDVQPRPLVMIKSAYTAAALAARVNGVVNEVNVVNADSPGVFDDSATARSSRRVLSRRSAKATPSNVGND